jgi:hypothetical protein
VVNEDYLILDAERKIKRYVAKKAERLLAEQCTFLNQLAIFASAHLSMIVT